MANQLSDLTPLTREQYGSLSLHDVPKVYTSSKGAILGLTPVFDGAITGGRTVAITMNYPAGYDYVISLAPDGMAIDVDLKVNRDAQATTEHYEVSIDVDVFTSTFEMDIDVQSGPTNPPATTGTWTFVKSVVVYDKMAEKGN